MNKEIFRRRLALLGMVSLLALTAGCASRVSAPVRDGTQPPAAAAPVERVGFHVVRPGETVLALSRMYNVSVADIVGWNGLTNPNQIHVGQELRVAPETPVVAQVIPITSEPVVISQVVPQTGGAAPIKQEPRGGKQPYSDEAWEKMQRPGDVAVAEPKPPVAPAAPETPRLPGPDGDWLWPVKGKVIVGFDEPVAGDAKLRNKGIDIAGTPGTPVLASAGGKVVYSGSGLRGLGKLVIIKHDANYLTAYAHNQQLLVKEAETVTKGQKIAELGSTDADRPKLHFEIRKQGQPVDPLKYLPAH